MMIRLALSLTLLVFGATRGYADTATSAERDYNLQRARAALPKVVIPKSDDAAPTARTIDTSFKADSTRERISQDGKFGDLFEETDRFIESARKLETAISSLYHDGGSDGTRAGQLQNEFHDMQKRIHSNLEKLGQMMAASKLLGADASMVQGAAGVLSSMRTFHTQCTRPKRAASEVCVTTVRTMNQMTAARADMMRALFRGSVVRSAEDSKERAALEKNDRRLAVEVTTTR